jgi:hypothetical protein
MESTNLLVEYTRGKQFVLSSGAENIAQLRGPHDAGNIACVMGLPEEQARRSICDNCGIVLQHAYARRLRYTAVELVSRPEFKAKWSSFDHLVGPALSGPSAASLQGQGQGQASDSAADESSGSGGESESESEGEGSDADSMAAGLAELRSMPGLKALGGSGDSGSEDGSEESDGGVIKCIKKGRGSEGLASGGGSASEDSSDDIIIPTKRKEGGGGTNMSVSVEADFLSFGAGSGRPGPSPKARADPSSEAGHGFKYKQKQSTDTDVTGSSKKPKPGKDKDKDASSRRPLSDSAHMPQKKKKKL